VKVSTRHLVKKIKERQGKGGRGSEGRQWHNEGPEKVEGLRSVLKRKDLDLLGGLSIGVPIKEWSAEVPPSRTVPCDGGVRLTMAEEDRDHREGIDGRRPDRRPEWGIWGALSVHDIGGSENKQGGS